MLGIVTLYHENYQPLADLILPNWKKYCARHGYELLVHRGEYGGGQIGFEKMRYLQYLLKNGLDIGLILDLDVLLTNIEKPFTDFIQDFTGDYFVTKDINGINNGTFIIKNTQWSQKLVTYILDNVNNFTCEQNVLKTFEKQLVGKGVTILSHPSINSYLHPCMGIPFENIYPEWKHVAFPNVWKPGCFALHLPGMGLEARLDLINKYFTQYL